MTAYAPPGWVDEPIRLVPYDPRWPTAFAAEAAQLAALLGPAAVGGVHHVGSTAVPGLTAKPVIDILVGVPDLSTAHAFIEPLRALDYRYGPYQEDRKAWFCKPDPARRTHHLHLVPVTDPEYPDLLAFRDFLRSHPDTAEQYQALKQALAAVHRDNREAYTGGKTEFVAAVLRRARHASDPPTGRRSGGTTG